MPNTLRSDSEIKSTRIKTFRDNAACIITSLLLGTSAIAGEKSAQMTNIVQIVDTANIGCGVDIIPDSDNDLIITQTGNCATVSTINPQYTNMKINGKVFEVIF